MEKRTAFQKKEVKAKFDALRNECGHEGTFRMIIAYLFDTGWSTVSEITPEEIQEMEDNLKAQEEENRKKNVFSLMTPEYQRFMVEMAVKFTQAGTMFELLKYIQNEMFLV